MNNVEAGQEKDITADVEENNCVEELTWLTGQQQRNIKIGKELVSENIVNSSDRILSKAEIKVLSKGLDFCPTPTGMNKFELVKDLRELGRRIKCKAAFHEKGDKEYARSDKRTHFWEQSSSIPNEVDPALELLLNTLEERV